MNADFLFACRVCQSPLVAAAAEHGALAECPNCGGSQAIPADPAFGINPSSYVSDAALVGDADVEATPRPMLRRVRLKRDPHGRLLIALTGYADPQGLPRAARPPEDTSKLKAEIDSLKQLVEEQNRQLSEWQTCHESVERELKKASTRAKGYQAKINEVSNELAQARHELQKLRTESDRLRKSNEALNRQLQGSLKAGRTTPQSPSPSRVKPPKPLPKGKAQEKPPGELAA